ncbi:MAG: type II toxin-antitoxin system HicA family toxin [Bacteroidales bacterium]|nr:type II toxin-antitoxin system HicA family toxin [Candidatus Physcousia equi]
MKRLVISKGYKFEKHGKKHDIYRNPETNDMLLIERHWSQEVRVGLMKKILSQIGE